MDNPEMRTVAREGALLAGGARAILLQVAHPAVARGVAEHSDFAYRPLDRLRATLMYVYGVTYGTPEETRAVAAMVSGAHRAVIGPGYRASDPELQLWVAATLYDTAVLIYEELFGPLETTAAERVYEQYAVLGTALQVPAERWPADRAAFRAYWDGMIDTLEVSDDARRVARDLLHPVQAPLLLRTGMPLNRFLTAAWLPDRIRQGYGISWEEDQQRRYDVLVKLGAAIYPRLPAPIREAPKTWYLRDLRRRLRGRANLTAMAAERPPLPPFTRETAAQKVQAAEDAWNTHDPERVAGAYSEDSVWRNRDQFFTGRDEIVKFLTQKWERERDYSLRKNLWAFDGNRIAVRFQYESQDRNGQWWRSYGNELWEFDDQGYMRRREASINDVPIDESDRRIFGPRAEEERGVEFPLQ